MSGFWGASAPQNPDMKDLWRRLDDLGPYQRRRRAVTLRT